MYKGSSIEINELTIPKDVFFLITIHQTIHLESDSGIQCKNYPSDLFKSYQECDETFVYNEMKNRYRIMPFWAAQNLEEVTNIT